MLYILSTVLNGSISASKRQIELSLAMGIFLHWTVKHQNTMTCDTSKIVIIGLYNTCIPARFRFPLDPYRLLLFLTLRFLLRLLCLVVLRSCGRRSSCLPGSGSLVIFKLVDDTWLWCTVAYSWISNIETEDWKICKLNAARWTG